MTEWWVSQAKNWCKICRVWTGGHKQQIIKHETGRAHIENEERSIKDATTRDKKRKADEKDVADQLAEIERKALAAMAADAAPPPPRSGAAGTGSSGTAGGGWAVGGGQAAQEYQKISRAVEKRQIEEVIAGAKRRKLETGGDLDLEAAAWTKHVDPGSKAEYYYNTITKQSSWTVPEGYVEPVAEGPVKVPDGPCANGSPWTASTDPTSGAQYFYNSVTKVSSWERPAEFVPSNADAIAAQPAVIATPAASTATADAVTMVKLQTGTPAFNKAPAPAFAKASRTPVAVWNQPAVREALAAAPAAAAPAAAGPAGPAPVAATPGATPAAGGSSPWVVCTDATTGYIYYFNMTTKASSWDVPADLGVDLSKPPPPPSAKPPGPPKRKAAAAPVNEATGVGEWEEVVPESSMWKPTDAMDQLDSEEEREVDEVTKLKYLTMQRGAWMDEDYERHDKEVIEKKSSSGSTGEKLAFPINRKKASGIRKRDDEDEYRCF